MASLSNDHPRLLTFATNPKGQVISAIIVLCAIVLFNSFFYVFRPYEGMGVYQEAPLGEVYEVYPGGPADTAGVQVGDQILAIDDKPIDRPICEPRYRPGIKAGDTIRYEIERQGEQIGLSLTIGSYSENLPLLGSYLGIQFLSIGLWMIGLVLTLFSPPGDVRARLLSLGFLMAGLTAAKAKVNLAAVTACQPTAAGRFRPLGGRAGQVRLKDVKPVFDIADDHNSALEEGIVTPRTCKLCHI